jgi:hypothetical protein
MHSWLVCYSWYIRLLFFESTNESLSCMERGTLQTRYPQRSTVRLSVLQHDPLPIPYPPPGDTLSSSFRFQRALEIVISTQKYRVWCYCYSSTEIREVVTSGAGIVNSSGAPDFAPIFSGVHVTESLVLYVCFVDRCLSFCSFSFTHCVVCSSIYTFWLPLWYLQTLLIRYVS